MDDKTAPRPIRRAGQTDLSLHQAFGQGRQQGAEQAEIELVHAEGQFERLGVESAVEVHCARGVEGQVEPWRGKSVRTVTNKSGVEQACPPRADWSGRLWRFSGGAGWWTASVSGLVVNGGLHGPDEAFRQSDPQGLHRHFARFPGGVDFGLHITLAARVHNQRTFHRALGV